MEGRLEIIINIDDETPLFTQLIVQIKAAVVSEKIKVGIPLPSIRQLANDLEINHKTVAKAYRILERDGVIETKGYRGTFIHPNAIANCANDMNQAVNKLLKETLEQLKELGATDSEIRIAFNRLMNNSHN